MSDVVLFTISLSVTVLGFLGSWAAFRRRGMASGLRGAAWSLVPMAAYLTGLTAWAVELSSSVTRWAGVVVAGLAVALYMVSGVLLRRGAAGRPSVRESERGRGRGGRSEQAEGPRTTGAIEPTSRSADSDMADIEEILRRRGIQ